MSEFEASQAYMLSSKTAKRYVKRVSKTGKREKTAETPTPFLKKQELKNKGNKTYRLASAYIQHLYSILNYYPSTLHA